MLLVHGMDPLQAFTLLCCFVFAVVSVCFLYRLLRRRFPVQVTCWFCHEVTTVPYGNKNCWDCPVCEQYNGFNKDGGYNKEIPAMYDSSMNHGISCRPSEFMTFNKQLCERCNNNLHLKARLLADFVPVNEANYDEEVEIHSRRLDKWYDICMDCHMVVQQELQKQDSLLSRKLRSCDYWSQDGSSLDYRQDRSTMKVKGKIGIHFYKVLELLSLTCLFIMLANIVLNSDLTMELPEDFTWLRLEKCALPYIYIIGYIADLLSKLLLVAKHYRLHLVDVSVILWINICLLELVFKDWTNVKVTLYLCVANIVLTTYSYILKRKHSPVRGMTIRRLSLGGEKSNRMIESSLSDLNNHAKKYYDTPNSQDTCASSPTNSGNFDDTVSGLEAFTFGTPLKKSPNKSIFNSSFTSPQSSVPFPEKLSPRRPLISPAKLKVMSFSKQYREKSPGLAKNWNPVTSLSDQGLISSTSSQLSLASTQLSGSQLSEKSFQVSDSVASLWSSKTTDSRTADDNNSEGSHSSRSSVCPVDSTTSNTVMKEKKGSPLQSFGRKEFLYISILSASLMFNVYFSWQK